MLGWLIIALVSGLLLIVSPIGFKLGWFDYDHEWICAVLVSVGGLMMFIAITAIPVMSFQVKQEINTFNLYQEMVEVSYSEEDTELNFAMNIQVIELNTWLAKARASEETYGIFSFYKGKLDDLEYIEIGD